jgi:CRISPR/Cas system-associated exonuclease Cas4 (RecB family)
MTYSFTQISQYLRCPRQYRYRYLDGWREKEDKASMIFGRSFEKGLHAYFTREDSTTAFFQEWRKYQDTLLEYAKNDSWDRLYHQGIHLLERFAQDDRVRIRRPKKNLQVKLNRSLPGGGDFVSYIDAIGEIDGTKCIIDWKTTTSRYPEQPAGLLALDPQLICYSWMTGIADVALVVFVRKNTPEIQYLKTTIAEVQRREFGQLVETSVSQIEAGQFLPHSGIRFPRNACVSCSHLGICLGDQELMDSKLIRRPGASDLDWIDQFED